MPLEQDISMNEFDRLRLRVQNHNDEINRIHIAVAAVTTKADVLEKAVDAIRSNTASSTELAAAVSLLTLKLEHVHDDLAVIKKAIYWSVGLIIASVGVAVMALVLRQ